MQKHLSLMSTVYLDGSLLLSVAAAVAMIILTDRVISNTTDRVISNITDRVISNITDRVISNIADRVISNIADRVISNITDRVISNITDRVISNTTDRVISNITDRVISNTTDRVISNTTDRVISNITDRVISNTTDRVISNTTDRVISNTTDRVISNTTDRVISNTTDRVISNTTDRVISNTTDRVISNITDRVISNIDDSHKMKSERYGNETDKQDHTAALRYNATDLSMSEYTTNPRLVVGVVILLLMVLNLFGNSLVFFVYRFRVKPSVFSFYVTVLAALDIITALTTMLIDVIVKMRPLDETFVHLTSMCKISHFEVYAQSLISGCVLTLIAYQRYRKICRPLVPGLKIRTAKVAVVVITLTCVIVSVPLLIINGPQDVQVKLHDQIVNVTICRYEKAYQETRVQFMLSIFLTIAFVLVLCLTVIFYVMVARALKKFERRNSRSKCVPSSPHVDLINQEQGYTVNQVRQHREHYPLSRQSRVSIVSSTDSYEGISAHMFKIFAIITAILVVSYLPHLLVLIITNVFRLDYQVVTFTERLLLDLAYNCPYISCVANPVVYGFRNAEFREHLKRVFTCSKRR